MPDVTDRLIDGQGLPALTHQDFTFDEMHEYSDLDYKMIRFGGGIEYKVLSDLTFTAQAEYADLTDETGWVYGNETGSWLLLRSGIRFEF